MMIECPKCLRWHVPKRRRDFVGRRFIRCRCGTELEVKKKEK